MFKIILIVICLGFAGVFAFSNDDIRVYHYTCSDTCQYNTLHKEVFILCVDDKLLLCEYANYPGFKNGILYSKAAYKKSYRSNYYELDTSYSTLIFYLTRCFVSDSIKVGVHSFSDFSNVFENKATIRNEETPLLFLSAVKVENISYKIENLIAIEKERFANLDSLHIKFLPSLVDFHEYGTILIPIEKSLSSVDIFVFGSKYKIKYDIILFDEEKRQLETMNGILNLVKVDFGEGHIQPINATLLKY
jgi:hypothetical protein